MVTAKLPTILTSQALFLGMFTILHLCLSCHSGSSQEFRKTGYFLLGHYLHRLVAVFLIFSLELGLTEHLA